MIQDMKHFKNLTNIPRCCKYSIKDLPKVIKLYFGPLNLCSAVTIKPIIELYLSEAKLALKESKQRCCIILISWIVTCIFLFIIFFVFQKKRQTLIDIVEYVERAIGTFILAAAREVAFSPSACARQCIAEGDKPKGRAIYIIH